MVDVPCGNCEDMLGVVTLHRQLEPPILSCSAIQKCGSCGKKSRHDDAAVHECITSADELKLYRPRRRVERCLTSVGRGARIESEWVTSREQTDAWKSF